MHYLSVDQGQLVTGIIAEHGMLGMWMFWAGWLGIFVIPLVFAPLWRKMDLMPYPMDKHNVSGKAGAH